MRADRLLSALMLLQTHGRLTGRELARKLEVSARTVHRDMEALCQAGVPVFAERGARGGWRLSDGWQTSVPGLEETELRALLMAQPARLLGDMRLGGAAQRAIGKLTASLPLAMRQQAVAIQQRLFIDVDGWRGTTENVSLLPVVQDAVQRDRKLRMRYWRQGREMVERLVDPLGLVAKGSAWYLVARTPDGFRTYKVSRIDQATVLEEPCERPPDFDLESHWKASAASYQESFPRYAATLHVHPRAAGWLKTWRPFGPVEAMGEPDAEGWMTVRVLFEFEEAARFAALGLGPQVDVIAPTELRDRVRADAEALLARMGGNDAATAPPASSASAGVDERPAVP